MTTDTSTEQDAQAIWNELAATQDGTTATTPPPAAAEPVAETPAAPATETPPVTETKPDPLTELIARFDKIESRQRNVEGHIGGLKDAQQRVLDMVSAAKTAADATTNSPTQTQVKEAVSNPAEWDALKSEFPEWAKATESLLDARLSRTTKTDPAEIDKLLSERLKNETDAMRKEFANQSLEAAFPGWQEDVRTDAFGKWLDAQPDAIKALAASPHVKDAATMLRLFETVKQTSATERINEERKQKLAAAAATPRGTKAPPQKSFADMTAEELWNYEAAQREKERGA